MPRISKRQQAIRALVTPGKLYSAEEALALLKSMPPPKRLKETVELAVNLGVDTRKSDQVVRGAIVLPKGTGRKVRVAVITTPAHLDAATQAGADLVGDEVVEQIKAGNIHFDTLLATPDAMRVVGQLGQILGPRGLMPNPKDGTVTNDIAKAIKNAKSGQVRFRADKAGIVHCAIGKVNFTAADLNENLQAILATLRKVKPASAKGIYFKKITLSTTMGPGLALDTSLL